MSQPKVACASQGDSSNGHRRLRGERVALMSHLLPALSLPAARELSSITLKREDGNASCEMKGAQEARAAGSPCVPTPTPDLSEGGEHSETRGLRAQAGAHQNADRC